jgi:hypothetical protein
MANDAAGKTEKGRTMCIWPETNPEGTKWYARWSDEDEAKKVIGWSRGEAIYNCVGNVGTAIVWDEEVIRQRQEKAMRREERKPPAPMPAATPAKSVEIQPEADFLETAPAEPILAAAVKKKTFGEQKRQTESARVASCRVASEKHNAVDDESMELGAQPVGTAEE